MTKLEPAVGWVVVRKELPSEKTAGGIIKPPSALDRETGMQATETPEVTVEATPSQNPDGSFRPEHCETCESIGCYNNGEAGLHFVYPNVGDRVVVNLRAARMVPFFDDENPYRLVQGKKGSVPMAQLYLVMCEDIVAVVRRTAEEK